MATRQNQNWRNWRICDIWHEQFNWDFSELLKWYDQGIEPEVRKAWIIELDRELGLNCEPFLKTWQSQHKGECPKQARPKGVTPIYYEDYLANNHGFPIHWGGFNNWPTGKMMFEIDWTCSFEDIKRAFSFWLEHEARIPGPALGNLKKGAGNKDDYKAWFKDLAIYRLHNAGWTRKQGLERLRDFLCLASSTSKSDGSDGIADIPAPHWSRCVERTRKKISVRESKIKEYAKFTSQRFEDLLGRLP